VIFLLFFLTHFKVLYAHLQPFAFDGERMICFTHKITAGDIAFTFCPTRLIWAVCHTLNFEHMLSAILRH